MLSVKQSLRSRSATAAIALTRERLARLNLQATLVQADALEWQPAAPYDAIYEQTCLCALRPDQWRVAGAVVELTGWFRNAQKWRTGSEGRISLSRIGRDQPGRSSQLLLVGVRVVWPQRPGGARLNIGLWRQLRSLTRITSYSSRTPA